MQKPSLYHQFLGKANSTASVVCALWLIQNVPDVMAIIQSLYRIYKYPKEREGATLTVSLVPSLLLFFPFVTF